MITSRCMVKASSNSQMGQSAEVISKMEISYMERWCIRMDRDMWARLKILGDMDEALTHITMVDK